MKLIKSKKLSKALSEYLAEISNRKGANEGDFVSKRQCRAILAALEYERQRADDAEKKASAAEAVARSYRPCGWHD